jgi:bacteriocin-like protein
MIIHSQVACKNISDVFSTEILTEQELAAIYGGIRPKGKSRDKDILDVEDEDAD